MKILFQIPGIFFLVVLFMVAAVNSFAQEKKIVKDAELIQIEKTINDCIGWAKTKNIDLLYSIIAHDSSYLEVQPGERIVKGFTNFKKAEKFWMNPDFKAIRYEIRDLQINLSQSGNVAWYFCMLDDINEWKGEPASWINTRWTGVLEKRNGKWEIVQMHFSNPVSE